MVSDTAFAEMPTGARRIGIFSEKEFQCGASIAALRYAVDLSRSGIGVEYNYQHPSNTPFLRDRFPSVEFRRIVPDHSAYARETLETITVGGRQKAAMSQRFIEEHLRKQLKAGSIDVAHIHNYSGSRDSLVSIATTKPLVWTLHDTSPVSGYHYRTYDIEGGPLEYPAKTRPGGERFWTAMRGKAFALTAPSKWLADYARASIPDYIDVRHIPNVPPIDQFYPMEKAFARAVVGLHPGHRYILFFAGKGAWRRKNFEIIARAFARRPDLSVHAVIVGGVADRQFVGDPRMTFLPSFDPLRDAAKIVALYNAVDAFCISSLIDNLPNTVLEAITCGRPVIGANVGGVPDMVEDGKNGWLFNPRDVDDVVRALERFIADNDRLDEMGAASLSIARKRFDRNTIIGSFVGLYNELHDRYAAECAAAVA